MTDFEPYVLAVGSPAPDWLRPSAIGVGFNGTPDALFLVFHEEFSPAERRTIQAGTYAVGLKLFHSGTVCGLPWRIVGPSVDMVGFANYSLAHVRRAKGDETVESFRQAAKDSSFAASPGCGLLLRVVFVDPDSGEIFALRAFTLPRLFSDRFLSGILATEAQATGADELLDELLDDTRKTWSRAFPGVAVAGEKHELSEGDWTRHLRQQRQKWRDAT